ATNLAGPIRSGVKILAGAPFAAGTGCLHWQHGENMPKDNKQQLRRVVVERLESLQQAGVLQLPKVRAVAVEKKETVVAAPKRPAAEATSPEGEGADVHAEPMMRKKSRWQP